MNKVSSCGSIRKQNDAPNFQHHHEQKSTLLTSESTSSTSSSSGIAIIGASYAGLTLANMLHNNGIPYRLYEIKSPPFTFVTGGTPFCVPSLPHVRKVLKLEKDEDQSPVLLQNENVKKIPTRQDITNLLQQRVKENIIYDRNVIKIERKHDNRLYVHHEQYSANNRMNKDRTKDIKVSGPYQYVVGADGVLSKCRIAALTDVFLIGDARWVNDRWYDLGFQRIKQGADIAMQDAIELGEIILKATTKDKQILMRLDVKKRMKFCAKSIWMQRLTRNVAVCAAFLFIVIMWQRFIGI
jgi:hypothetical protein